MSGSQQPDRPKVLADGGCEDDLSDSDSSLSLPPETGRRPAEEEQLSSTSVEFEILSSVNNDPSFHREGFSEETRFRDEEGDVTVRASRLGDLHPLTGYISWDYREEDDKAEEVEEEEEDMGTLFPGKHDLVIPLNDLEESDASLTILTSSPPFEIDHCLPLRPSVLDNQRLTARLSKQKSGSARNFPFEVLSGQKTQLVKDGEASLPASGNNTTIQNGERSLLRLSNGIQGKPSHREPRVTQDIQFRACVGSERFNQDQQVDSPSDPRSIQREPQDRSSDHKQKQEQKQEHDRDENREQNLTYSPETLIYDLTVPLNDITPQSITSNTSSSRKRSSKIEGRQSTPYKSFSSGLSSAIDIGVNEDGDEDYATFDLEVARGGKRNEQIALLRHESPRKSTAVGDGGAYLLDVFTDITESSIDVPDVENERRNSDPKKAVYERLDIGEFDPGAAESVDQVITAVAGEQESADEVEMQEALQVVPRLVNHRKGNQQYKELPSGE